MYTLMDANRATLLIQSLGILIKGGEEDNCQYHT